MRNCSGNAARVSWYCPKQQCRWLCEVSHATSTVHNDVDEAYSSAPDSCPLISLALRIVRLQARPHCSPLTDPYRHWVSSLARCFRSQNPNTQRYSQTVRPCQLQHSCLFMYLCGFPADLSRCWVLRPAAARCYLRPVWHSLASPGQAALRCVRAGLFIQAFIMMPLSRSLRCLCSCSHLRPLRRIWVLAASHHPSHLECGAGAVDSLAWDLLSVFVRMRYNLILLVKMIRLKKLFCLHAFWQAKRL